jgi:hypothetical protein
VYTARATWDGESASVVSDGSVSVNFNATQGTISSLSATAGSSGAVSGNTVAVDLRMGAKSFVTITHSNGLNQDSGDESMLIGNAALYIQRTAAGVYYNATLNVRTTLWPLGGVSSALLHAPDNIVPAFTCTFQSNGGVCYVFSFKMLRNGVSTAFTMTQPFGLWTYGGASGVNQNGGWIAGQSRSITHSIVGSNFVLDLSNVPRNNPSSVSIALPFTWQSGDAIADLDIHAVQGQGTTLISATTNMKTT